MKVYGFCMRTSGVQNIRSWLFQIAHNCIIDSYRKEKYVDVDVVDVDVSEKIQEDENLAYKDAGEYLKPLLNFLPPKYALPLKLSDIDGLK